MQFQPLLGSPESTFWSELARFKLDVQKLESKPVEILGYSPVSGRAPGAQVRLCVSSDSFHTDARFASGLLPCVGTLHNVNTIEEFKKIDKQELINNVGNSIWENIRNGKAIHEPKLLNPFYLLTFVDLKKYQNYFWFAFPAFVVEGIVSSPSTHPLSEVFNLEQLEKINGFVQPETPVFLITRSAEGIVSHFPLSEYKSARSSENEVYVFILDSSSLPSNPGWFVRNVLVALSAFFGVTHAKVVSYRDIPYKGASDSKSVIFEVTLPDLTNHLSCPRVVGWEKNAQGKMAPRFVDLGKQMDQKKIAEEAVDLNLKLMRWRLLPELQVERVASTKCLLLGAGTLGCNVARCLMGWGVRHISLVDYGKVSFSNPVRQSLFEFVDCCDGGKPKAVAAADKLRSIFPDMKTAGYQIAIPMPGHPVSEDEKTKVKKDVELLEELISTHDVVFLLTDTRESRWLPTLLSTKHEKMTINSALGFDSYMVMRHGKKSHAKKTRLGCYFCNDVVAPNDSLTDRTLDQQCTVTRPGLSLIASSLAVELMVALLHHPLGDNAQSEVPGHQPNSVLGLVPHQTRGNISNYSMMTLTGFAFDKCTACSDIVINQYETSGFDFLVQVLNSPTYLEDLTGLTALKSEPFDVEWDEEDDFGDGFEDSEEPGKAEDADMSSKEKSGHSESAPDAEDDF